MRIGILGKASRYDAVDVPCVTVTSLMEGDRRLDARTAYDLAYELQRLGLVVHAWLPFLNNNTQHGYTAFWSTVLQRPQLPVWPALINQAIQGLGEFKGVRSILYDRSEVVDLMLKGFDQVDLGIQAKGIRSAAKRNQLPDSETLIRQQFERDLLSNSTHRERSPWFVSFYKSKIEIDFSSN